MEFSKDRIRGSLWGRGRGGFLAGALVILILLIWVPAIRWFLGISVVIGLAMAAIIHWYNERTPIKTEPKDQIVLHLNDDDEPLDTNRQHGSRP